MAQAIRLFVSHSANDAAIAEALIEVLRNALNLPAAAIRCTSVDGCRLPGGANTDEQLRAEALTAEVFLGLVSAASMRSLYVGFEFGARWGAGKHLLPLLTPGVDASVMEGPLKGVNALRSDSRPDLHQMIHELGERLAIKPASPAGYERYIDRLLNLAPSAATANTSSMSWSSMLRCLKKFAGESAKLQHLTKNMDLVPDELSFDELVPLLEQFSGESGRLHALKTVRPVMSDLSEDDLEPLLCLFSGESSKQQAFSIVR